NMAKTIFWLKCLLMLVFLGIHVFCCEDGTVSEEQVQKYIEERMKAVWPLPATPEAGNDDQNVYAACVMKPSSKLEEGKPQVTGEVLFKQLYPDGKLDVIFRLAGFNTTDNTSKAIHVHTYGDLSNGCDSTGGHFNPQNVDHPMHPGDFGNFTPKKGKIHKMKSNSKATMFGPESVLSRAVVVHEKEDDMGKGGNAGSLLHGNAGKRLACCVIGI
uniref:Superoxide dismutase [Cu-Zn] n=1 Tax=Lepisosteus oculatus TaxID=7918 RepID=W5NNF4_LEPOC